MADLKNPFDNVDVTETFEEERETSGLNEGTTTGNQNGTSSTTNTSKVESTGENESTVSKFVSHRCSGPEIEICRPECIPQNEKNLKSII